MKFMTLLTTDAKQRAIKPGASFVEKTAKTAVSDRDAALISDRVATRQPNKTINARK